MSRPSGPLAPTRLLLWALLLAATSCEDCKIAKPFNVSRLGPGSEPSVVVVPTGPGTRNYVVGFIGSGGENWSVSSDQGATWTTHSSSDPAFEWGPPAEASGGWGYDADPTLVTTGHPNQVAFVTIANGRQVAIAISTDGGAHFGRVHLVSDPNVANHDPEPSAAVNAATGQIWVAWTNTGTKRLMLRALHYDGAGALTFDTPILDVTAKLPGLGNLGPGDDVNVTLAAGDFGGKSHVALAYEDRYDPYYFGPCPGTLDLRYYIAASDDLAKTWHSLEIVHDPAWPQCVADNTQGGYNRNRPAIAFAGGIAINYYVALTLSSPTGSLVHVYRVSWPFQQGSVLHFHSNPPKDRARHDQFFPAIAVGYSLADVTDPRSTAMTVMVTWHDTREDPAGNHRQLVYGEAIGIGTWEGVVSPLAGVANEHVPWLWNDWWGDYDGVAADDISHGWVAAWTDNRIAGPPAVWTSVLTPLNP